MYLYNSTAVHFEDSFVLGYDSKQTQQKHLPDDTSDRLLESKRAFPHFISRTDAMRSRPRGEHHTTLHTLLLAC